MVHITQKSKTKNRAITKKKTLILVGRMTVLYMFTVRNVSLTYSGESMKNTAIGIVGVRASGTHPNCHRVRGEAHLGWVASP